MTEESGRALEVATYVLERLRAQLLDALPRAIARRENHVRAEQTMPLAAGRQERLEVEVLAALMSMGKGWLRNKLGGLDVALTKVHLDEEKPGPLVGKPHKFDGWEYNFWIEDQASGARRAVAEGTYTGHHRDYGEDDDDDDRSHDAPAPTPREGRKH
jgi:hypothetical protein